MKNKANLILLALTQFAFSQVKDISFTLAPLANYTWWANQSGLENSLLYGGKLGFGFGEYLELRAVYLQSHDLKTNFSNFGIPAYTNKAFVSQKLNLNRWGGELKINLGKGTFIPYMTLGTGVQNIKTIEVDQSFDQIYTTLGLGIKTRLNDRIVLNLEAQNTAFNFDSGKNLLTDANKTTFGVQNSDFKSQLLYNWSAQASLQFYLGGRKPGTLSALDKAYLNKFKGGFRGIQWVFEPGASFIKFADASKFKDSYFLGGYFGLDFNRYTGLRVFFFQATENQQLSTRFDKFNMYGLEFRARLNDGNGVTPYLIFGGGYLNPTNDYLGKSTTTIVEGEKFASAGLGLNIPLSKNFLITGGARAMVSSSDNVEDLSNPDALQTHIMYNAGLKLTFGAKSKDPEEIYKNQVGETLNNQTTALEKEENEAKLSELSNKYKLTLDSLKTELAVANRENNVKKAVPLLEKKNQVENALAEVEKVIQIAKETKTIAMPQIIATPTTTENPVSPALVPATPVKELIKMTPAELELLIDKILDKTDPAIKTEINTTVKDHNEIEQMKEKINYLEKLILEKDKKRPIKENANETINKK